MPGAHSDVCDLAADTGRLASYGLPDGEGPGRQARCGIAPCGACHSRSGVWSGSFVPSSLALLSGVVKGLGQSSRIHLLRSYVVWSRTRAKAMRLARFAIAQVITRPFLPRTRKLEP